MQEPIESPDVETPGIVNVTGAATAPVRVMVAIGVNPSSDRLLRRAAKLAHLLNGELFAVHIVTPRRGSNVSRANIDWHLQQARQLGAHVEVVQGKDIASALVQHARKHQITHLVLGQSDISRWREAVYGSIVNSILRFRSGIDLYIVPELGR